MDIIRQSLNSGKLGLVLGLLSLGVGLGNREGILNRIDKCEFVVLDGSFPDSGIERIGVFFTIGVNELVSDRSCCEKSNFVKFHLNLGL